MFYVSAIAVIMSVYPWDQIDTSQSPFVQVFSGWGLTLRNFSKLCGMTAALSAANSTISQRHGRYMC